MKSNSGHSNQFNGNRMELSGCDGNKTGSGAVCSKKELTITYISLLFCFLTIYVFPISSTLSLEVGKDGIPEHGTIYRYSRLIALPLAIFCLSKRQKIRIADFIEFSTLLMLAISAYFINEELPATSLMILISIVLYDQIFRGRQGLYKTTICKGIAIHLVQIALMSFLFVARYGYIRVINNGKDPNYTAYFLIMLYYMLGNELDRKLIQSRDWLLFLSIFTWSRTALLAVTIIYICRIFKFNNSRLSKFVTSYPFLFFIIAEILWLLICKLFVVFFDGYDYVYQFRTGVDRFSTFIDESNYMRAAMNTFLVEDICFEKLLFGYKASEYSTAILNVMSRVNRPHNAFFAIYQKSGIFFALALIRRSNRLFRGEASLGCMYLIYLLYSLILGPSFYYGLELVILLIAVLAQKKNSGDVCI